MVTAVHAASSPKLVIFDLCDTLYDANTTVGFIGHYAHVHGIRRMERSLRHWTDRSSPYFYLGALCHRLLGWDIARRRLVAALAGEAKERLDEAARDYARDILPPLANAQLHQRLTDHQAAGDRVVLVSSSLDLVVAPIAAALGVEYRASALGFENGICTGRIARDLTGRKAAVVRELAGSETRMLCVYTDNRSDLDLVAMADQAAIVIPRGSAGGQWGGNNCEYLRL